MPKAPASSPAPKIIKKRASSTTATTTTGVPFVEQIGNPSEAEREEMVRHAAYHIAEKDGFQTGREEDYWHQAEQQINAQGQSPSKNSSDLH